MFTTRLTELDSFLSNFFPDDAELLCLRAFPPRGLSGFAEKIATSRAAMRSNRALQARLLNLNRTKGLYFVINAGGDCDSAIERFNAFMAEIDDRPILEQHADLDRAPIRATIRVETRKSVHAYWLIAGNCATDQWREVQLRLIAFFKSDPKIKNPSRVMRLPFFNHVSIDSAGSFVYKLIELVPFNPARRYTVEEMLAAFPAVEPPESPQPVRQGIDGTLAGSFDVREHLHLIEGYRVRGEWGHGRCPVHRGQGTTSFFVNVSTGAFGCLGGCASAEIRLALGQPKRRRGAIVLSGGLLPAPKRPAKTIELDLVIERPAAVDLDLEIEVGQ